MSEPISINLHDTSIGLWRKHVSAAYRDEVFAPLIRMLRDRGWMVAQDRETARRFPVLRKDIYTLARGSLMGSLELRGRVIKLEFWSLASVQSNRHGRRYDFDKLERMPYLDRQRFTLIRRTVIEWAKSIAPISITEKGTRGLTPAERIARDYAESWHTDKTLGRPVCREARNARSADGGTLEQGAVVWFRGRDGRVRRGLAYYHINNMWWVIDGSYGLRNLPCFELFTAPPAELRRKMNPKLRRESLERELEVAIGRMDFARADILRRIAFGAQDVFRIWSEKHGAWYRSLSRGYTSDRASAGLFTAEEARAQVLHSEGELRAIGPNGKQLHVEAPLEAA